VGAEGVRKAKKRKINLQQKGWSMPSIWTDRMNQLHASNEVWSTLMNAVTHCQTVGLAGGDAGEKAEKKYSATEGQLNAINLNR
jgi:hypothetical protein